VIDTDLFTAAIAGWHICRTQGCRWTAAQLPKIDSA